MNEQDYLRILNPKLMTNATKAIIKAHINHYQKFEIYKKFPNLSEIESQQPLSANIILVEHFGSKSMAFLKMNLTD